MYYLSLQFFLCSLTLLNSSRISNDEDFIDIRLSDILIPRNVSDGTVYVCQEFELPLLSENQVYDLVKFEALVDPMVHHIILFACNVDAQVTVTKPHVCSQSTIAEKCLNWLAQWSLGMNKTINLPKEASYKIGRSYATHFHLQIHLHTHQNEDMIKDDTFLENSGFRLYYSKNEDRKYQIGNVQIGQESIEIAPLSEEILIEGGCSNECIERKLIESNTNKIYLTRVYLHMHYLGVLAELSVIKKNSSKEQVLVRDINYNYAKPNVNENEFIEIEKGDRLVLKCYYNSKDGERSRNQYIRWGEGANAEMCYAFITYYPRLLHFNKCVYQNEKDLCFY